MSFSVVMPIHNERKFLLYSLPSIIRLDPNEIVLIFDRCDDDSFIVAKNIIKQLNFSNRVVYKTVLEDTPKEWVFRVAWLRRMAFLSCKNDWILNTDSDIVLNPKIKNAVPDGVDNLWFSHDNLKIAYTVPGDQRNIILKTLDFNNSQRVIEFKLLVSKSPSISWEFFPNCLLYLSITVCTATLCL